MHIMFTVLQYPLNFYWLTYGFHHQASPRKQKQWRDAFLELWNHTPVSDKCQQLLCSSNLKETSRRIHVLLKTPEVRIVSIKDSRQVFKPKITCHALCLQAVDIQVQCVRKTDTPIFDRLYLAFPSPTGKSMESTIYWEMLFILVKKLPAGFLNTCLKMIERKWQWIQ